MLRKEFTRKLQRIALQEMDNVLKERETNHLPTTGHLLNQVLETPNQSCSGSDDQFREPVVAIEDDAFKETLEVKFVEASPMQERVDVQDLVPRTEEDLCERNGIARKIPAQSMAKMRISFSSLLL